MQTPIRLLFVCTGNICRSPMAEALFRHLARERGLEERFVVDSAGTGTWLEGAPPHAGTLQVLARRGIDGSELRARRVTDSDLSGFDWVLCMDRENVREVKRLGPVAGRLELLLRFDPQRERLDVPDPYVLAAGFEEVFELLERSCRSLLDALARP